MNRINSLKFTVTTKYDDLKRWLLKNVKYIKESDYVFDEKTQSISLTNFETDAKNLSSDFYSGCLIKRIFECVRGTEFDLFVDIEIDSSIIQGRGSIKNKKMSYKVYDIENDSIIRIVL